MTTAPTGRRLLAGLLVVLLQATLVTSTSATEDGAAGGDITFRLTLRGGVAAGDAISLAVNASNGSIISPGIRCGSGSEDYTGQFRPCQPGNYDFVVQPRTSLPVGTELTYLWARTTDVETGAYIVIYTDTVTVTEAHQVLTVVYDIGSGVLPDTALQP